MTRREAERLARRLEREKGGRATVLRYEAGGRRSWCVEYRPAPTWNEVMRAYVEHPPRLIGDFEAVPAARRPAGSAEAER